MSVSWSVRTIPRGVLFRIGNQEFMLANTELDPDDPESEKNRDFFVRMITYALRRLADESDDSSEP